MAQAKWLEQVQTFFKRTKKPELSEEQIAALDALRKEHKEWFLKGSNLVKDLKGCAIRSQGAMDKLNAACEETLAHRQVGPALHMMAAAFAAIILSEREEEEGLKELQWFILKRTDKLTGSDYFSEFLACANAVLALHREGLYDYYIMHVYPERLFNVTEKNTTSADASVSGS